MADTVDSIIAGIIVLIMLGICIKYWETIFGCAVIGFGLHYAFTKGYIGETFIWCVIAIVVFGTIDYFATPARKGTWTGRPTITGIPPCSVYIIADGYCHKVGIANDVERRLATLQTGHPNRLELVRVFTLPSRQAAMAVERESHRRLDAYRVGGEWFQADRASVLGTVAAVAQSCGQMASGFDSYEAAKNVNDNWVPAWAKKEA